MENVDKELTRVGKNQVSRQPVSQIMSISGDLFRAHRQRKRHQGEGTHHTVFPLLYEVRKAEPENRTYVSFTNPFFNSWGGICHSGESKKDDCETHCSSLTPRILLCRIYKKSPGKGLSDLYVQ